MVTPEERITRLEAVQEANTQQMTLVLSRLEQVLYVIEAARQESREMNEVARKEAREMNDATRQEARGRKTGPCAKRCSNWLRRRGGMPATCSSPQSRLALSWLPGWAEGLSP